MDNGKWKIKGRRILPLLCGCAFMLGLTAPVLAVDNYSFSTENPDEFYQTGVTTATYDGAIPGYVQELYDFTPQTVHTSEYGATVIVPELDIGYGLIPEKPRNAPGQNSVSINAPASGSYGITSDAATLYPETSGITTSGYTLTPVEDVRKSDGSIGTLKIPAIGLTVTAYDGEVTAAMKSGVGHIDSTSAWSSNVGLVGHNRGVNNHFGKLKKLKLGDEITYTTALDTRTYVVTAVDKIASTDWSWLQYTADNRITLITCVEDQPQYRLAVQAVEKSSASH